MSSHPRPPDWDRAAADERAVWLAHAARCAPCRAAWAASDPSRLFALLAGAPVDGAVLEDVRSGVMRAVRADRVRAWPAAAAAVAAAVLAAALLATGTSAPPRPASASVEPAAAGFEVLDPGGGERVVDLTVGDTRIVMVYDERLQL